MRQDMAKVLVERERRGVNGAEIKRRRKRRAGNNAFKRSLQHEDSDNGPTKESMGRHRQYGWNCKELNENLSPLKRFIKANVGRPWDQVYSEIRAHVRFENTVQQHILQHLWQYVERNIVIDDEGYACHHPRYGTRLIRLNDDDFYVHPVSGLLLQGKIPRHGWRKKPTRPTGWRDIGKRFDECRVLDGEVYIKAGGLWFEADMRPVPEGIDWGCPKLVNRLEFRWDDALKRSVFVEVKGLDYGPQDKLLGRFIGWTGPTNYEKAPALRKATEAFYGRLDRYCAGKGHQLDTKKLKLLGLVND